MQYCVKTHTLDVKSVSDNEGQRPCVYVEASAAVRLRPVAEIHKKNVVKWPTPILKKYFYYPTRVELCLLICLHTIYQLKLSIL